jgi:hypothetical protein
MSGTALCLLLDRERSVADPAGGGLRYPSRPRQCNRLLLQTDPKDFLPHVSVRTAKCNFAAGKKKAKIGGAATSVNK